VDAVPARPLDERYWYLDGTDALPIDLEVGAFWSQLMNEQFSDDVARRVAYRDGWLVGVYDLTEDMTTYEMHPEGDELHFLASGAMDLVLLNDDGTETSIPLTVGTSTAVPRGVWHRFVVHEPTRGLAITAGRGTQHRPIET
jgi:mannose-6-phosphate isomerase-like protein (cupin superfamily)